MSEQKEAEGQNKNKSKRSFSLWRLTKRVLLVLIILWVLLMILLQIPAVQQYIIRNIAESLSEKTKTTITVDNFQFKFFDEIELEGVYVEDYDHDTLLFADRFKLKFKNPFVTYLRDRVFQVEGLALSDAKVNLERNTGETETNFQKFLSNFQKRDTLKTQDDNAKFVFELQLNEIILRKTNFQRRDSFVGVYQNFYLHQALLNPHQINIRSNEFIFSNAVVDSLDIEIANFKGTAPDSVLEDMAARDEMASPPSNPILLRVNKLDIFNSKFEHHHYLRSPTRNSPEDELDWDHLTVNDIGIEITDFKMYNWTFTACLDHLEGKTKSGFEITHMHTDRVTVDTHHVDAPNIIFETPHSYWSVDVQLMYDEFPAFKNYVDEVRMEVDSREGEIAIEDIITFAPGLEKVRFFNENRREKVLVSGEFEGTINNFNGDKITMKIGDHTYLKGYFSSRNLAVPEETLLNLEIVESRTRMRELRKLLPEFKPPQNFNKLGQIQFKGRFDGFYRDFVAYGDMRTEIGRAQTDMRMHFDQETNKAQYSGQLELSNFNMGAWTDNPEFGLVNFNAYVSKGEGLTLEDLNTSLTATIQELTYKNYTYQNFTMDGRFEKALFEGYFNIDDENINFSFTGNVDMSTELPVIDVIADVNHVNLKAINITERKFELSGMMSLEISNYNLDQLQASVNLDSVVLIQNDSIAYTIDSLSAVSNYQSKTQKSIEIHGNIMDGYITGHYDLESIWPTLKSEIIEYYPKFREKLGWKKDSTAISQQNFAAELKIYRSKNWPQLLYPKLDSFVNTDICLEWNNAADSLRLDFYSPYLKYDLHQFYDGFVYIRSDDGASNLVVGADSAVIQDQFNLKATTIFGDIVSDTLFWTVNTANYDSLLDNFNLQGKTFIKDQYWSSKLSNKYLELFNDKWYISPNNIVQVDSHYLHIEHFNMQHEERKILLRSINDKGIGIALEGINLSLLNELLVYDKLKYAGQLTFSASKEDFFVESAMEGTVHVDSLHINGDDFGTLNLKVNAPDAKSALQLNGGIIHPENELTFNGHLFANNQSSTSEFYDVDLNLKDYSLSILEYFIGDNISNTEGVLNGSFHLTGPIKKPVLNGEAVITNGAVTIDFLGTRIFIEDQIVRTLKNEIDVTGAVIQDIYGNTAELSGGLIHDYFTDLGLDFRLVTDNFLLLNTTNDNETLYYGHCMGSAQIDMFGSINAPDINIVAENNTNTQFYLRTDISTEEVQAGFFKYMDLSDTVTDISTTVETLKGVNLSLDITANESAEVQIIIDQETGDIIKGRGNGNIKFYLNRTGEINMFGEYNISSGQYLFTAQTIVNKTFPIEQGSTIRWTGDPFDAIINIKAQYEVITAPYYFVQDIYNEAGSATLSEELKQPTEVVLIINLTGLLYSPKLNFDIRFPNLSGQAKTLVENKLSSLEDNPSEMYNHAGALIVFNTFLPTTSSADPAKGGVVAGINTISEFVSTQFSGLLSSILSSAVEDVDFIDEINFNLKYNIESNEVFEQENIEVESGEFRLRTSARLFERVEVDLGGNYGVGNTSLGTDESGTYFTGNFAIQYALTKDRRLVLRVYSGTDRVLEGRRFRSGIGLRYQQEFDSFDNFFESLKSVVDKGKSGGNTAP